MSVIEAAVLDKMGPCGCTYTGAEAPMVLMAYQGFA